MARLPRVVVIDVPHHVTQRGNAQQVIFAQNADRVTYLELLRQYSQLYGLSLLGYCLMSNHVHLIVAPHAATALANTLKHTHGRYASYWNACQSSTGHVWQGRFYSCPLDDAHPWEALRYTELNPVRAWSRRRSNGSGRALPCTVVSSLPTRCWTCSRGKDAGRPRTGTTISAPGSPTLTWPNFAVAPSRGDL